MPNSFPTAERTAPPHEASLATLLDVTLPVTVELGRARLAAEELSRLKRGAVIQLDRLAGEPVDIYVGDRLFAHGEVVVLGDEFGVRITRILARPHGGTHRVESAA